MRSCALLILLFVSVWADINVNVASYWNGVFQAEPCFDIYEDLHEWNVTLTFNVVVTSVDAWAAGEIEKRDSGKVYVLHSNDANKEQHVGDRLCIGFIATTDDTSNNEPRVNASLTSTTGPVTSPVPFTAPPGQTLKPTNTPGTFKPGARLAINGTDFTYNKKKVFLSGANLPWISYGCDFGDGQFQQRKVQMERQLRLLKEAGANSLRIWVHIQAETTPAFDSYGLVVGLDTMGTFLGEFIELLNLAQYYDILITPCLWNAAVNNDTHSRLDGLIKDPVKLQSYIAKALIPWATAVKGHPALGSWDIMNEPEGMLNPDINNDDPCYNSTALADIAGWAGKKYSYEQLLRFINWQAAALKNVDPSYLVSVGVSNPRFNTLEFGDIDHYSNSCLIKAGGKYEGVLDFYQFHTRQGNFNPESPFVNNFTNYTVNKPILVGQFEEEGNMKIVEMFDYIYNHGYAGAWSWNIVGHPDQRNGISHIKNLTTNEIISITIQ